jgi:hypothetical protein
MNSFIFLVWFENQVMPALKNPGLVVLDNASYHNVKTEDKVCPNFSQTKAVLQNYLTIKPSLRVHACKTIKRLPLSEGIFGASDLSFGSHI